MGPRHQSEDGGPQPQQAAGRRLAPGNHPVDALSQGQAHGQKPEQGAPLRGRRAPPWCSRFHRVMMQLSHRRSPWTRLRPLRAKTPQGKSRSPQPTAGRIPGSRAVRHSTYPSTRASTGQSAPGASVPHWTSSTGRLPAASK